MKEKAFLFKKSYFVCLFAVLCCFLWGSAFPTIKIGYRLFEIDGVGETVLFAGLRFTLAGVLIAAAGSVLQKKFLFPKKTSWGYVGSLSLAQTAVQYLFFYIGLSNCTGVKSSVIGAMGVFFTILVSSFIFRQEKFTPVKLLGCIVGFAGIVLINFEGLDFSMGVTGEGFLLLAALSSAFSSCMIKKFSDKEDPVTLCAYQFMAGGILLTLAGVCLGGRIDLRNAKGILILLYLAFISSCAYTLWGILLKYNRPSRVAVYGFLNPVFGVVLSAWWLGEEANVLLCLVALALVSAGIIVINLFGEKKIVHGNRIK